MVDKLTIGCGHRIFGGATFVVYIEELSCYTVGKRTIGVSHITRISPHVIVTVTLVKRTVSEVHVTIGEELAIKRTTIHIDGTSVLETVIVDISENERHILEGGAIGDAGNTASSGVVKYHAIDGTFDSYIL